MSRLRFELARVEDDAALRRRMAEDWIEGDITVSFRREPSYFAATCLQGDRVQTLACFDDAAGMLVGMGSRASAMVYVNGAARRIGYLADLRCHRAYRRGTLLARGYRYLRTLHEADPLPFYATVIYEGNEPALRALRGARAGLPVYRPWGRLLTPALRLEWDLPAIEAAGVVLDAATEADMPAVLDFLDAHMRTRQFAPAFTSEDLSIGRLSGLRSEDFIVARRDGVIVGTIALWDQSALRKTHVERYRGWLGAARPAINAWRAMTGGHALPAAGERIPYVYLACFAVARNDLQTAEALLRAAYRRARRGPWHFAICGLHERDPLAECLSGYKRIAAAGCLFAVHYPEDEAAVASIDDRVPYLEAGCL